MTNRTVTTQHAVISCDVCGRTLLRGEHAEHYLTGGERRQVCELCTVRAGNEGWIRESEHLAAAASRPSQQERRALFSRLLARRERAAAAEAPAPEAELPFEEADDRPPAEPLFEGKDGLLPEDAASNGRGTEPVEAEYAYEPAHDVHAVPTGEDGRAHRAMELFNASEHPRTVAGVARSLGAPVATVQAPETSPSLATIVVAWELCWYRYEVDLADGTGVRLAGQGYELDELGPEDQVGNAAASDQGALAPAA